MFQCIFTCLVDYGMNNTCYITLHFNLLTAASIPLKLLSFASTMTCFMPWTQKNLPHLFCLTYQPPLTPLITPSCFIAFKPGLESLPLLSTSCLLIYQIAPNLFSSNRFPLQFFPFLLESLKALLLDLSFLLFTLPRYPIFFTNKHFLSISMLMTLSSISPFLPLTPPLP